LRFTAKGFIREFVKHAGHSAWIIPDVCVAFLVDAFLDRDFGTRYAILSAFGLGTPGLAVGTSLLELSSLTPWRGPPFSMLLFSSALETIPPLPGNSRCGRGFLLAKTA